MIDKNIYCGVVGRAVSAWIMDGVNVEESFKNSKIGWPEFVLTLSTPYGYRFRDQGLVSPVANFLLVEDGFRLCKGTKTGFEKSSFLSSVVIVSGGTNTIDGIIPYNDSFGKDLPYTLDFLKYTHLCHIVIRQWEILSRRRGNNFWIECGE